MTKSDKLWAAAWDELEKSVILYRGEPVGTVAARDPDVDALNYTSASRVTSPCRRSHF